MKIMKKAKQQSQEKTQESLGKQLQNSRIAQGLSLEQIIDKTKISGSNLRAMEEDNYQSLPAKAFARSFYAQYAEVLGLDPKKITGRFLKENNDLSRKISVSMNQRIQQTDSMTKPKGVFFASRIGLALLLFITLASGICWQRSINPATYFSKKLRSLQTIENSETTLPSSSG